MAAKVAGACKILLVFSVFLWCVVEILTQTTSETTPAPVTTTTAITPTGEPTEIPDNTGTTRCLLDSS